MTPYVLASAAVTIDGFIDDASDQRLLLSNNADFDRVDDVRAGVDAILVGATTIRRDNARLLVRSAQRRADRIARGLPANPIKVTLTGSGNLDADAHFFVLGDSLKVVYAASSAVDKARERVGHVAVVVDAGEPVDLQVVLADLVTRGVRRLMVEGGSTVHTQFLSSGLVDELHLVIAPVLVGDANAPRFLGPAAYPGGPTRRMTLAETRVIGDVVLLRYLPKKARVTPS